MRHRLVIIGAGMATGRLLDHLLAETPDAWDITLFNAEPRGSYDRIQLSPLLAGEKTFEQIVTHDAAFYARSAITCRFGERVEAIDRAGRVVHGEQGPVPYDKLVIATGSAPFVPALPGHDLTGVMTYRDLEDTEAMLAAARAGKRAVVIGGGVLGLEAAAGMRAQGMEVTLLHIGTHLMERQLDPEAARLLRTEIEARGIPVHLGARTEEILGRRHVEGVRLADGKVIGADLVLFAAGIRPRTDLALDAGLDVGRGITVCDRLLTSDPDILALGECTEFDGQLFGLVAPLFDQAEVAAATLAGRRAAFVPRELATKLKVTGCALFSAGDFAAGDGRDEIVFSDPSRRHYKRLVIEDGRLIGAVLYGDTADSGYYTGLIRERRDIAALRDGLVFGPAFAPEDPAPSVPVLVRTRSAA